MEIVADVIDEWKEYVVRCEGADELLVGTQAYQAVSPSHFLVKFENRVGYATLQPRRAGKAFKQGRRVEVVSPKLGTYSSYREFTDGLIRELFEFGAGKVFDSSGETSLSVVARGGEQSLLFLLHFLLRHHGEILRAISMVAERPHLSLIDLREERRLSQVTRAGSDLLRELMRGRGGWTPASQVPVGRAMNGYVPARIECLRGEDATDNPENRFVASFMRLLAETTTRFQCSKLWELVPAMRQTIVRELHDALLRLGQHPTFSRIARVDSIPSQSRVLTRREGYRQLFAAWTTFHQPSSPLFDAIENAIELRDVSTLYEQWCFFSLADHLSKQLGDPTFKIATSNDTALAWNAIAEFSDSWTLKYNATRRGYSLPFRPDLLLSRADRPIAVFDAKFRATKPSLLDDVSDPKRADIDKMHAYRDGLGVPAAVVLYPGSESWSFPYGVADVDLSIEGVINGWQGVGALPLRPGGSKWQ